MIHFQVKRNCQAIKWGGREGGGGAVSTFMCIYVQYALTAAEIYGYHLKC